MGNTIRNPNCNCESCLKETPLLKAGEEPEIDCLDYNWPLRNVHYIKERGWGSLISLSTSPRKIRLLKDTTPLHRGIIRHLILIIDLSTAMLEKDLRPTRYSLTLNHVEAFIKEFFDQNPISQLGIIGMRDGLAVRISDVGGNPSEHVGKVSKLRREEPKGQVSLQNALEMGRGALL